MKNHPFVSVVCIALVILMFFLTPTTRVRAQSASDLVSAVNALRASEGLAAYNVDPALMAYAQQHSDYMAGTQTSTHLHSDGTLPQSIGLQENVAGGDVEIMTAAIVVNEIWVDWGHRHILTGYPYGDIGAGWAVGDDGLVYCSVNVRPLKDAPTYAPPAGTAAPFTPYGTSTPDANGSIYHVVSSGQTLWSIAVSYGVTMDEIRRLNSLASDWTTVYPNQKLLIRIDVPYVTVPPDTTQPEDGANPPEAAVTPTPTALAPLTTLAAPAITPTAARKSLGAAQYVSLGLVALLIVVIIGAFVFGIIDLTRRERP